LYLLNLTNEAQKLFCISAPAMGNLGLTRLGEFFVDERRLEFHRAHPKIYGRGHLDSVAEVKSSAMQSHFADLAAW
jgi:hypothetical protein